MTASQRFGRFAIPFGYHFCSVLGWFGYPLQKRIPGRENGVHAWDILTCGISQSPVDSCLDCMAREVTLLTRIYLANRSQPSPGGGVHCRAKWVAHPRASRVGFCAFFCAVFASSHDNTLRSNLFHMELCHDDSSVIISKAHHWFSSSKFFLGRGEVGLLHSFDCDFNSGSKSLTHVSLIPTIRHRNAWPSTLNLCFSNAGISRPFCLCSAVKQWGTLWAYIYFFANRSSKYGILMLMKSRYLRYFLASRSTILCKKVRHKFHTSFICCHLVNLLPWVIV